MTDREEIRAIAREVLALQEEDEEARAHRTTRAVLTFFGIDPDDPEEIKAARRALKHSMLWASATEKVGSISLRTAVTTLVVGFMGLLLLAFQTYIQNIQNLPKLK